MKINDLLLLKRLDRMKEWLTLEWCDRELIGKSECVEYVEVFSEAEEFIKNKEEAKALNDYIIHNYSIEDIKAIKRMYEETKHFVGFNSLEFSFFIDDLIDEIDFNESLKPEVSSELETPTVDSPKGIKGMIGAIIKRLFSRGK